MDGRTPPQSQAAPHIALHAHVQRHNEVEPEADQTSRSQQKRNTQCTLECTGPRLRSPRPALPWAHQHVHTYGLSVANRACDTRGYRARSSWLQSAIEWRPAIDEATPLTHTITITLGMGAGEEVHISALGWREQDMALGTCKYTCNVHHSMHRDTYRPAWQPCSAQHQNGSLQ